MPGLPDFLSAPLRDYASASRSASGTRTRARQAVAEAGAKAAQAQADIAKALSELAALKKMATK